MDKGHGRITATAGWIERVTKNILLVAIDIYRVFLSPLIPTQCRFSPTCSDYMRESIEKKGVLKGLLSGMKRILRCNPFHPGGFDPVK